MMKHLTVEQMREADRRAIQEIGIPSVVLMENAGKSVFDHIGNGPIAVFCGKGNNGGDGFVIARHALLAGYTPQVWLTHPAEECTPDAQTFLNAYQELGGKSELIGSTDCKEIKRSVEETCKMVIDALLGTGCTGEVRGTIRNLIELWPSVKTIAVDIPSGLNADTGDPCGAAVSAATTITFQYPKKGFLNPVSKAYTGDIVVADIGIPEICGNDKLWNAR
jgi:NAD(P)H-hydrate epimerase